MGFLRIYLALCVIAGHTSSMILPWPMHSGAQAVQIFYLVSGFYMALVASKYASAKDFYTSRFLRIFVPYWIILAGVMGISALAGWLGGNWLALEPWVQQPLTRNGLPGLILAGISNITIFLQDWFLFLKNDAGQALMFTTDWRTSAFPLWKTLLIPQAWSVSLELTFYLLVPWLNKRKTRLLILIVAASLLLRVLGYELLGVQNDPWTYRFFPYELATFVLGMLSYRAYAALKPRLSARLPQVKTGWQYLAGTAGLLGIFFLAKGGTYLLGKLVGANYAEVVSIFAWWILVPLAYTIFGNWKTDRTIGELSYPVYLTHVFVVELAILGMNALGIPQAYLGIIGGAFTVGVSLLMYRFFFHPIEERRQAYIQRMAERYSVR